MSIQRSQPTENRTEPPKWWGNFPAEKPIKCDHCEQAATLAIANERYCAKCWKETDDYNRANYGEVKEGAD